MERAAETAYSGVIDQNVEPAKVFLNAVGQGGDRGPVGNIASHRFAAAARLGNRAGGFFQPLHGSRADDCCGSGCSKPVCNTGADAPASSGDKGYFLLEVIILHFRSPWLGTLCCSAVS